MYTLAAVGGLRAPEHVLTAAYNITQMEWTHASVDEAYLEEFKNSQCYLRFAHPNEGLWFGYHSDGGSTIYFGDRHQIPVLPLFYDDRRAGVSALVCGTTRPLSSFSMMEAIVFQRTFLRSATAVTTTKQQQR